MTAYAEFRLRIEKGSTPRSYRVEASGLGGDAPGKFKVPFSETELENFVLKVGRTRRGVRRIESPEMELARSFGGRLFKSVMQGQVADLYRGAFSEARASGKGLRLTLSLTDVPELAGIPWEYLYDPPDFLSISTWTPVVRYLDLPRPRRPLQMTLPLRILGVVSAPSDAEPLDSTAERAKLDAALKPLRDANAVTIDWLEEANLLALARKLRSDSYHILHFIGHGGFDDANGEGALLFEDDAGRGRAISGDQLGTILHDKVNLRLVLLNSCEGARNAVNDPFSGVATSLVRREIPAVIGMQFEITDRAAVLFASEFYSMLAEGQAVDSAITEARLAIFADHNDVEWGTPVLFMRVADGRLFDVADATVVQRPEPADLPEKIVAEPPAKPVAVAETETEAPAAAGVETEVEPATEPELPAAAEPEPIAPPEPEAAVPAAAAPPHVAQPAPATEPAPTGADTDAAERDRLAAIEADRIELGRLVGAAPAAPLGTVEPAPEPKATPQPKPATTRISWRIVAVGIAAVVAVLIGVRLLLPPTSTGFVSVSVVGATQTHQVAVRGGDFAAGEALDVSLDGTVVQSISVSDDGTFSLQLDIGDRTAGVVTVVGGTSGNQAQSSFTLATADGSTTSETTDSGSTPPASDGGGGAVPTSPGILFYSDRDPDSSEPSDNELYLLDPTTRDIHRLTDNDNEDTFPTWSPDHTHIAFSRDGDIYTSEFANNELVGDATPMTEGSDRDFFPTWSSADMIAFVRQPQGVNDTDIMQIPADKSRPEERLISGGINRAPAWSKDGHWLAYMAGPDTSHLDITIVPANGSADPRSLTSNNGSNLNPNWSPDGTTIVFVKDKGVSDTSADNEIYKIDVATGAVSDPLTSNDVQDGNPVWSPDGTQICFYRAQSAERTPASYHLLVMNADGSGEDDLTPDRPGRNLDPIWR
jgi:hypothetical protein